MCASCPEPRLRALAVNANLLTGRANRMTEATSLASWTRALRKQLDALDLDSAALCREAGLDPQLMDDPNARYPLSATTRLWHLAVQASGDPAIGLRVSRFVSPTTFHALGYALVASGSLREVFERIVRYHQVVSDALELALTREADRYRFFLKVPEGSPQPAFEAIDAFAAIYVRTCRNRLGRDYAPLAVQLRRPARRTRASGTRYSAARCNSPPWTTAWSSACTISTATWTTPTRSWPSTTKRCSSAPSCNCGP
ncbi:hypothetical protein PBOI14_02530 [Pseudomonas sp. Boi14]|nr:hypothetical protein PBOI14_02530 [Pseudomonas sp. Boi14]